MSETIRSEIGCHECSKQFVAELDITVDGDYIIECPHCAHEHYRSVRKGKVTEGRWGSQRHQNAKRLGPRSVWKSSVIKAQTSTVAWHIRERWLNRSDRTGATSGPEGS